MKKVFIVEYQGRCEENGKSIGHGPKVITEYCDFISDFCDITIAAPDIFIKDIKDKVNTSINIISLPHHILMKGKSSVFERIKDKLNRFDNVKKSIRLADENNADIIWFYNVEYYLHLYFLFHKRPKQKLYLTMFIDGYFRTSSFKDRFIDIIRQKVFEAAQKKYDLIISACDKFKYKNCRSTFIPDYYYIPEIFDKRQNISKSDTAVSLGTMWRGKQLKEMIGAFKKTGYKLTIAGRFYDKTFLDELVKYANEDNPNNNIEITDKYLSYDEYLDMLAAAKYSVIPYSKEVYSHQTSGVLQESIFLNTIPVTYNAILTGNGINGTGFDDWDKITSDMFGGDQDSLIKEYSELIKTTYSKESVAAKFHEVFG